MLVVIISEVVFFSPSTIFSSVIDTLRLPTTEIQSTFTQNYAGLILRSLIYIIFDSWDGKGWSKMHVFDLSRIFPKLRFFQHIYELELGFLAMLIIKISSVEHITMLIWCDVTRECRNRENRIHCAQEKSLKTIIIVIMKLMLWNFVSAKLR